MKTELVAFRLLPSEKERLEEIAASSGERASDFVRRLVREVLNAPSSGQDDSAKKELREGGAAVETARATDPDPRQSATAEHRVRPAVNTQQLSLL